MRLFNTISIIGLISGLLYVAPLLAEEAVVEEEVATEVAEGADAVDPADPTKKMSAKEKKDEARFPIGCRPVGFKQNLKVLTLYPGQEGALQSLFFVYNKLPQTVSLYQMRDKDSELSTRYNHSVRGSSWAALATGEPRVQFLCSLGDGKSGYGNIVDCEKAFKVCEYVNVKFGLNNKGNFWVVDSNTRNGAVNEVVHYGIIPGV